MHQLHRWLAAAACVALGSTGGFVCAQTARSGGNASAQLLQEMQQLASERTTLQAENEKLKNQLADMKKDRDALKTGQQAVERRAHDAAAALERTDKQRDATDQELTQIKAKMQELIAKFRETIQKLREAESDDAATRQSLASREHELAACADRNTALYKLDDEVLTRLEKEGVWSRVAEKEPFTRIKRVELENLVDENRTHAQEQRFQPKPTAAGGGSATPVPPAAPAAPESSPAGQPAPEASAVPPSR